MNKIKQLWQFKSKENSRKLNTVRFMFPVVFSMFGAVFLANVASFSGNNIFFSAQKTAFNQGEQFSVDIMIKADEPINTVSLVVGFSNQTVEAVGMDVGRSVLSLWAEEPRITKDEVVFSGGSFKRGFRGEHLIGTVKFIAKNSGEVRIFFKKVELLSGDGSGNVVKTSGLDNSLELRVYKEDEKIPDHDNFMLDKKVTLQDISIFMTNWRSGDVIFDFNKDNKVNLIDFSILLARYSLRMDS